METKEYLFTKTIDGWDSWGRVFCDLEAFRPLCREVLRREGLGEQPLKCATPGTNAVFLAGPYVLKLFVPVQSGVDTLTDYRVEQRMLWHAASLGVRAPRLVASGEIEDKYLFRYLILERVSGLSADQLLALAPNQQETLLRALAQDIFRLHREPPSEELLEALTPPPSAEKNERWQKVPPSLAGELLALSSTAKGLPAVLVHGDLTRDNLLLRPVGTKGEDYEPVWIDFADSHLAPACYELPPLVFELLLGEPGLVRLLCRLLKEQDEEYTPETFLHRLLLGVSLHEFGGDILREYFTRIRLQEMAGTLEELTGLLRKRFFGYD